MMLSSLVTNHKAPKARFTPGLFLLLLIIFIWLGQYKPTYGLTGLGVTLVVTAILVEANRDRIWDMYRKSYKKQKGIMGVLSKPNKIYYTLNVFFLWPIVFVVGLVSLYVAYQLS
jgi:hypothetical protein